MPSLRNLEFAFSSKEEAVGDGCPDDLPLSPPCGGRPSPTVAAPPFDQQLTAFNEHGEATRVTLTQAGSSGGGKIEVATYVNEFWTARQRQANSLHEVSYRACFKPQLPRFFIERLTEPGDWVYDPFMGRGTTPLEAALMGRVPVGCDVNPLSVLLTKPRLNPPAQKQVADRLSEIDLTDSEAAPEDLLVFFHPETLGAIAALRRYFRRRLETGQLDSIDAWIRLVALNRLTGHSKGFFSVYTLPPNQAVSVKSQRRINERRGQVPDRRDVRAVILKKSRLLMSECGLDLRRTLGLVENQALLITASADRTPQILSNSVSLVVTSPPFLKVVQYEQDNWLRCWFAEIDPASVAITMSSSVSAWSEVMTSVFHELARVLKPGGHVAFEVGEVQKGTVRLEEAVIPCGLSAGLEPRLVMINDQEFTKTANCWGVGNNAKGTNTNRIVLFQK